MAAFFVNGIFSTFASLNLFDMARAIRIVVHCTATRAGDRLSREALRHLFFEVNGWKHWGYHAVVHANGSWEVLQPLPEATSNGAMINNNTTANGAAGYNRDSLHIAYVGGLDRATGKPADTRTAEQKKTLWAVIACWTRDYKITEVVGHRDLPGVHKACPCFDAKSTYRNA